MLVPKPAGSASRTCNWLESPSRFHSLSCPKWLEGSRVKTTDFWCNSWCCYSCALPFWCMSCFTISLQSASPSFSLAHWAPAAFCRFLVTAPSACRSAAPYSIVGLFNARLSTTKLLPLCRSFLASLLSLRTGRSIRRAPVSFVGSPLLPLIFSGIRFLSSLCTFRV